MYVEGEQKTKVLKIKSKRNDSLLIKRDEIEETGCFSCFEVTIDKMRGTDEKIKTKVRKGP